MKIQTKIRVAMVAVPVAAAVVAGSLVVRHVRRRRERKRILSRELRASVEELLRLRGEDFLPDGLGTSLYYRKLASLDDRRLIAIYALVKVGEVMRSRGVDAQRPTKEQLGVAFTELKAAMDTKQGRKELLEKLGSFSFEVIQSVLRDGLLLAAA